MRLLCPARHTREIDVTAHASPCIAAAAHAQLRSPSLTPPSITHTPRPPTQSRDQSCEIRYVRVHTTA